jgi:hypothetical protein
VAGLAQKLGVRAGHAVCLLDAPAQLTGLLQQESHEGATFAEALNSNRFDVIIFWPTEVAGLAARFAELQEHIVPEGVIWAVIPKKQFAAAHGLDFTWAQVREAALQTDLVDSKVASVSPEEYATRFVIRKERRVRHG